jgi:hypothetical protein
MGKKKSKYSKHVRAMTRKREGPPGKAKKSMGGLKVTKGLSSKFRQATKSTAYMVADAAGSNKKTDSNNKTPSKTPLILKSKQRKVFLSSPATTAKKSPAADDEQSEFKRQMASLHERQWAKANKPKVMKKSGISTSVAFQPATFSLEKSTTDLLHEAVHQMEAMSGVGNVQQQQQDTPVRTNLSWAAEPQGLESMQNTTPTKNNPFEALGDDSEDENAHEWNPSKAAFNLAPASFLLLPRTTPTPAPTPCRFGNDDDDTDPDL